MPEWPFAAGKQHQKVEALLQLGMSAAEPSARIDAATRTPNFIGAGGRKATRNRVRAIAAPDPDGD